MAIDIDNYTDVMNEYFGLTIGEDFFFSRIAPDIAYDQNHGNLAGTLYANTGQFEVEFFDFTIISTLETLNVGSDSLTAGENIYAAGKDETIAYIQAWLQAYYEGYGLETTLDAQAYYDVAVAYSASQTNEVSGGFWLGYYLEELAGLYGSIGSTGYSTHDAKVYFMINNHEDTDYPTTSISSEGEWGVEATEIAVSQQGHEVGAIKQIFQREGFSDSYDASVNDMIGTVLSSSISFDNVMNFKRTVVPPLKSESVSIFKADRVTKETTVVSNTIRTSTTTNGSY